MILLFAITTALVAALGGAGVGYAVGRYDRWLDRHPEDVLARRDRWQVRT